MKHTKGPWRVREGALFKDNSTEVNPNLPHRQCQFCGKVSTTPEPARIQIEAKGFGVAQIGTLRPVEEFEQHMANARLIAAAPDLLAVLKKVNDLWAFGDDHIDECSEFDRQWVKDVRALLEKVEP